MNYSNIVHFLSHSLSLFLRDERFNDFRSMIFSKKWDTYSCQRHFHSLNNSTERDALTNRIYFQISEQFNEEMFFLPSMYISPHHVQQLRTNIMQINSHFVHYQTCVVTSSFFLSRFLSLSLARALALLKAPCSIIEMRKKERKREIDKHRRKRSDSFQRRNSRLIIQFPRLEIQQIFSF